MASSSPEHGRQHALVRARGQRLFNLVQLLTPPFHVTIDHGKTKIVFVLEVMEERSRCYFC